MVHFMIDPKILDDITRRVADAMPPAAKTLQQDMEKNLRSTVQSVFNRLELVTREEAQYLADSLRIPLLGLGGDHGGMIGALAAVGLAASQEDGRYVMVGRSRELRGLQPISAVLSAGIRAVQTLDGQPVTQGLIQTDKLRPARRGGQPVAVVEWDTDHWLPLKLD